MITSRKDESKSVSALVCFTCPACVKDSAQSWLFSKHYDNLSTTANIAFSSAFCSFWILISIHSLEGRRELQVAAKALLTCDLHWKFD